MRDFFRGVFVSQQVCFFSLANLYYHHLCAGSKITVNLNAILMMAVVVVLIWMLLNNNEQAQSTKKASSRSNSDKKNN